MLKNQKTTKENEERESLAKAHLKKGNKLHAQGKHKEAREVTYYLRDVWNKEGLNY